MKMKRKFKKKKRMKMKRVNNKESGKWEQKKEKNNDGANIKDKENSLDTTTPLQQKNWIETSSDKCVCIIYYQLCLDLTSPPSQK